MTTATKNTEIRPVYNGRGFAAWQVQSGDVTHYYGADWPTACEIFAKYGRVLTDSERRQLWDDALRLSQDQFANVQSVYAR